MNLERDGYDIEAKYIPERERAKVPAEDFAGPGRTFPVRNQNDVENAAYLVGHAADPNAVRAKIIAIAKRKGLAIPDSWRDHAKSLDAAIERRIDGAMEGETLVSFGSEVKALGDGKVGGYLIVHSTHRDPDLTLDFFERATDYGAHKTTPILYDHGFDAKVRSRTIGNAAIDVREAGVWLDGQLEMRDEYEKNIYGMVEAGKLGWSSGTASHLVEREAVGKAYRIKRWPLGLDASLTTSPAEPRTHAITLKSLATARDIRAEGGQEKPQQLRAFERFLREAKIWSNREVEQIARMGFKQFIGLRDGGNDEGAPEERDALLRQLQASHLRRQSELRAAAIGGKS